MIQIVRGALPEDILDRQEQDLGKYESVVADIIARVRHEGDEALRYYARKFDGVELDSLEVPREELLRAEEEVGEEYLAITKSSSRRVFASKDPTAPSSVSA